MTSLTIDRKGVKLEATMIKVAPDRSQEDDVLLSILPPWWRWGLHQFLMFIPHEGLHRHPPSITPNNCLLRPQDVGEALGTGQLNPQPPLFCLLIRIIK